MQVRDARSGKEVTVGETVTYADGGSLKLLSVEPGLLSARAQVVWNGVTMVVPLQVRWTHPRFFLQHVAFIPS